MGSPKITSPRVTVIREGFDPLEVQTDNRDAILWDKTRIRHKWGRQDEQPYIWLTFLAWAAARRTGAIPADLKYEVWETQVIDLDAQTDEDDDEIGNPTQEAPEPD